MADVTLVIDALAARFGGTAFACVQLARHLAGLEEPTRVVVVTRRGSIVDRGLRRQPGIELVTLREAERLELPRRLAWEAAVLPRLVRARSPTALLSWSGMLPRRVETRLLLYLTNPVMFERSTPANRIRRRAARQTARHASLLMSPTRASASLVSAAIQRHVAVVPHGIDGTRFAPSGKIGNDVLCVGDFYRHKRHDLLLDAWSLLPAPRPRLRLIGDPEVDTDWARQVHLRARSMAALGQIDIDSHLPLTQLVQAYHAARVFVMPSEHESFCLPVLEALSCAIPVVARSHPALAETGGPGTTYVAGNAPADWAAAIGSLLHDADAHRRARIAGLEHAAGYSWTAVAAEVRAAVVG